MQNLNKWPATEFLNKRTGYYSKPVWTLDLANRTLLWSSCPKGLCALELHPKLRLWWLNWPTVLPRQGLPFPRLVPGHFNIFYAHLQYLGPTRTSSTTHMGRVPWAQSRISMDFGPCFSTLGLSPTTYIPPWKGLAGFSKAFWDSCL
jgi:hypothetical protein